MALKVSLPLNIGEKKETVLFFWEWMPSFGQPVPTSLIPDVFSQRQKTAVQSGWLLSDLNIGEKKETVLFFWEWMPSFGQPVPTSLIPDVFSQRQKTAVQSGWLLSAKQL